MSEHDLQDTIALLSRTPAALNALLRDLPESWTQRNEGESTWSAYDVIGHFIHGEQTDWIPRAKMILEHGEGRAFERFDRFAQERESKGKSLPQLLDEFAQLRKESIRKLEAMKIADGMLDLTGTHPDFGRVTLKQFISAWRSEGVV